jgi:hypothetical protein
LLKFHFLVAFCCFWFSCIFFDNLLLFCIFEAFKFALVELSQFRLISGFLLLINTKKQEKTLKKFTTNHSAQSQHFSRIKSITKS